MATKEEILDGMSFVEFDFKARHSFKFFCERLLGINTKGGIHPFQIEWVDSLRKHDFVVIKAATGHSKTMTLGVWNTLWECYKDTHREILVISKTLSQAKKVFRDIRDAIELNPILSDIFGTEKTAKAWNEQFIYTKNFNKIRVVPYNSGVRGYRAHLIYADEVDSYEETDTYFEDVVSRLHPGGKLILTSTPSGPTNLLAQIKERDQNEGVYHFITTPAITRKDGSPFDEENFSEKDFKDAKPVWPEMFSMETIRQKWATQGKWKFISQQLCHILGETENTPFPIKNIVRCYDKDLSFNLDVIEGAIYFIGADFANSEGAKADYTAYTIIEFLDGVFTLKWIEKLPRGTQTPMKVTKLSELYNIFNKFGTCRIVADITNIGTEIVPRIRNAGMSVIEQPFQWRLRREMIQTCSNVMQNGGDYIKIPKKGGPENINYNSLVNLLQDQLAGFLLTKSDKGNENYKSKAVHDDLAISFMMALKEASKMSMMAISPRIVNKNNQAERKNSLARVSNKNEQNNSNNSGMYNTPILRNNKSSLVRIVR